MRLHMSDEGGRPVKGFIADFAFEGSIRRMDSLVATERRSLAKALAARGANVLAARASSILAAQF